jgi:predicted O-methyltransferase YrrM
VALEGLKRLPARERLAALNADREVSRFYPPSYGAAIWHTVLEVRPRVMVEFGVHRGYTAIVAALAMEHAGCGQLRAYDWWEDGKRDGLDEAGVARAHFDRYSVHDRICLEDRDFFEWIRQPEACDLLYFDIDNDGEKVEALFDGLRAQIERGLPVLIEGGSDERDRHVSMQGRRPIAAARPRTGYRILVDEFPSLSLIAAPSQAPRGTP